MAYLVYRAESHAAEDHGPSKPHPSNRNDASRILEGLVVSGGLVEPREGIGCCPSPRIVGRERLIGGGRARCRQPFAHRAGYLSDQETKVDLLNNEAIATSLPV